MKKFILFLIIILGFVTVYNLRPDNSNSKTDSFTDSNTIIQNPNLVIQHISKNISNLSPEKEQLGGTFYVTNITLDSGSGVVKYEDGHNAYTARFDYSYINEKEVAIKNFTRIE